MIPAGHAAVGGLHQRSLSVNAFGQTQEIFEMDQEDHDHLAAKSKALLSMLTSNKSIESIPAYPPMPQGSFGMPGQYFPQGPAGMAHIPMMHTAIPGMPGLPPGMSGMPLLPMGPPGAMPLHMSPLAPVTQQTSNDAILDRMGSDLKNMLNIAPNRPSA